MNRLWTILCVSLLSTTALATPLLETERDDLATLLEENVFSLERIAIAQLKDQNIFSSQYAPSVDFDFDSIHCEASDKFVGTCSIGVDLNYPNSSGAFVIKVAKSFSSLGGDFSIEGQDIEVKVDWIEN